MIAYSFTVDGPADLDALHAAVRGGLDALAREIESAFPDVSVEWAGE